MLGSKFRPIGPSTLPTLPSAALLALGLAVASAGCRSRSFNSKASSDGAAMTWSETVGYEEEARLFADTDETVPKALRTKILGEFKNSLDLLDGRFRSVSGVTPGLKLTRINVQRPRFTSVTASSDSNIGPFTITEVVKTLDDGTQEKSQKKVGAANTNIIFEVSRATYEVTFHFADLRADASLGEGGSVDYVIPLKEPITVEHEIKISAEGGLTLDSLLALPKWLSLPILEVGLFADLGLSSKISGTWHTKKDLPDALIMRRDGTTSELTSILGVDVGQELCRRAGAARGWDVETACALTLPILPDPVEELMAKKTAMRPERLYRVRTCEATGLFEGPNGLRTAQIFNLYISSPRALNRFSEGSRVYLYDARKGGYQRRRGVGGGEARVEVNSRAEQCGPAEPDRICVKVALPVRLATAFKALDCDRVRPDAPSKLFLSDDDKNYLPE